MSKKSNERGRVRVFFAEFEGDNESIQQGLRAMTTAVNKAFQPATVVRMLPDQQPMTAEQIEEVVDVGLEEDEFADVQPKSAQRKKSKRKPPTMSLVKELNLRPEGKPSLRDFHAEKSPKTQEQMIAIAVYYVCKTLELKDVTANHVFTCFKDVGYRVPRDLPQIIRNTASRKGWIDPSDSSSIAITTQGENLVEHDLPSTNGD